jgi:hypothetical protein
MGQDKGGFYSYDALENLVGLDIHSAQSIVPEWQNLAVGETVRLAEPVALRVAVVEPDHALVIHGDDSVPLPGPLEFEFSWAFVVEPDGLGGSRLLARERYSWDKAWVGAMIQAVSWVSFVMSRAMLRGIKTRAERPQDSVAPKT